MTNNIPPELYERLQKLLRKSESAKELGSLEEAEAFAMKAQQILMEYNLTEDQIDLSHKEKVIEDYMQDKDFLPKNESRWLVLLYHCICKHHLCRGISHSHGKYGFSIFGEKTNVEIVKYICDQLEVRIRILAKEAYRSYQGHEKRNAFYRGFFFGAVEGIDAKLSENKQEIIKNNENLYGLIVRKNEEVNKAVKETYGGTLGRGKGTRTSAAHGREIGYQKGKSMEIHKGVGGSGAYGQKLLS